MYDDPLVSVVVPVYNTEKHLEKCLDSIVNQTYQNLQILLIDDGSSDASGGICDAYAAKDPRIVCRHQENGGVSRARNLGLSLAEGDYVHFVDSDDYLELDGYEYLLRVVQERNVQAVNFEYFITYGDCERKHVSPDDCYGLADVRKSHRIVILKQPFCINKFFSRRVLRQNRFQEGIFRGEDTLFAQEVLDNAGSVWFDRRPLYHYVQSEQSAVRGCFRPSQLSVLKLYEAYKVLYWDKYPELLNVFLMQMQNTLITIYFDMWNADEDYDEQQREFAAVYGRHLPDVLKYEELSMKSKLKFRLFALSPGLFCMIHKFMHRL